MSEISSASSASGATGASATHRSAHGGSRQGPVNLFSSLFSQASASRRQPASDGSSPAGTQGLPPGATDGGDPATTDADSNPLTQLLGWMDQTQDRQRPASGKSEHETAPDQPTGARLAVVDALAQATQWQGLAIPLTSAASATTLAASGEQDAKSSPAALSALTTAPGAKPLVLASNTAAAFATPPAEALPGPSDGGPGIDLTGMRPVAPGTVLTAAEMASLPTTRPASSANTMDTTGGNRAALASPASAVSTASGASASAPAPGSATAPVSAQAGLAQPAMSPAAAEATGSRRSRAMVHGQRENPNTVASTSQTSGNATSATASTLPAPTAQATTSTLPAASSTGSGGRSSPAAQDRSGKTLPSERSTVALDERFARTQAEATTVREGRVESTSQLPAGLAGADAAPQSRVDLAPLTSSASATDAARTAEARASDPASLPTDAEPTSVSHWSTQHLRHASLRVGEGTREAIDIQLSMDGKELNVDFRTDSAEARATLIQQADQSLGSLLERSGIQLGGVSVGAQHQHGQQPPRQTPPANPAASNTTSAGQDSGPQAPGAAPRGQLAGRQDSSRPLDLFV
jgi:flagellar hook-length control protein FliK